MPSNPLAADEIFDEALRRPPGCERAAYLDQVYGDDATARARMERLLCAHGDVESFLEAPAADPFGAPEFQPPIAEQPGSIIGPYKLLEQIGEGGFGVVFLAEQEKPVRRRVALKVVKPGMDTREVIARFEAERQALALMDHPNIAKVYDAGATETGRPYFVMELVQGVPITEYCDQCQLTTRERLELFVTVCQAVQHAHQKGIIHRDLKPTNVLVAMQDGKAAPKIIDFGVAKAIGEQTLTERTLTTAFAQMIGSPLYMSPEQAELSPLGVDTRSDIYSLGVMLYELLAGATPFDKDRLHEATYDELRRIIREEEPPRPSARLSSLSLGERAGVRETAAVATTIAEKRRTDPRRLIQTVRGELDWIVMKCLEKDRNRRYDSAGSLARDVERYLADEPVHASPPTAAYRFRKFAWRNKSLLAAGGAIAAALVVGLGLSTWQYFRATTESARAKAVSDLLREMLGSAEAELAMRSGAPEYHIQQAVILTSHSRTFLGVEDAGPLSMDATIRTEEAHRHIRQAIEAYDRMSRDDSTDLDRRLDAIKGLIQVLKVCLATPGFAGEVDELNRRLETELPKLLTAFPDSDDSQWETAMRYVDWAYALNPYPAYLAVKEHAFRKEIEILQKIARSNPKRPLVWLFLADAYDYLGIHYWASARPQDAEAAFLRAREIYDEHPAEIAAEEDTQAYGITAHYGRLAYFLAHTHREDEAAECVRKAADYARRITDPNRRVTVLWGMTPVQLRMGDHAGYRETCKALVEAPVAEADDLTKARQIFAWVLGPHALDDLSLPVKRAEELAANHSIGQRELILLDLGAALYRNRQYERAAEQLEASIAAYPSDPAPGSDPISFQRLFLAMTEWQLGHQDQARQLLAKTLPDIERDLQSPSLGWNQRAALEVLRREAQALIQPNEADEAVENYGRTTNETDRSQP